MGWNAGYMVLENQVINLYNNDLLTKEVLACVIEPFKETDCDSGGSCNLVAKDGLTADEIMLKVWNPDGYNRFLDEIGSDFSSREDRLSALWNSDTFYKLFWDEIWRGEWHIW